MESHQHIFGLLSPAQGQNCAKRAYNCTMEHAGTQPMPSAVGPLYRSRKFGLAACTNLSRTARRIAGVQGKFAPKLHQHPQPGRRLVSLAYNTLGSRAG